MLLLLLLLLQSLLLLLLLQTVAQPEPERDVLFGHRPEEGEPFGEEGLGLPECGGMEV